MRHADRLGIEVIPETGIPGHTAALLAAHPEPACTGGSTDPMLCASREETHLPAGDIIRSTARLFPSPYIHPGGDETAMKRNWEQCPDCREPMRREGLSSVRGLTARFFARILPVVREAGRRPILWCGLDSDDPPADEHLTPYPDGVTLVSRRNGLTPACTEPAARHGHRLLLAPGGHAHLDYPQLQGDLPEAGNWGMPVTTLEQSYRLDPTANIPEGCAPTVQGVMGTFRGEAIADIDRAFCMAFPRALALAEAGWSRPERRSVAAFRRRSAPRIVDLMRNGVPVRAPHDFFRSVVPVADAAARITVRGTASRQVPPGRCARRPTQTPSGAKAPSSPPRRPQTACKPKSLPSETDGRLFGLSLIYRPHSSLGSGPITSSSSPPRSSSAAGKRNESSGRPLRRARCTYLFRREALRARTVNCLPRP